jgi:hypothetical protein
LNRLELRLLGLGWSAGQRRRSGRRFGLLLRLLLGLAEMRPHFLDKFAVERARMRLLVGDADLSKIVQDGSALDFELARQLIDTDCFHLLPYPYLPHQRLFFARGLVRL